MEGLSFEEFTKKIYIAAPLSRIYRSWATEAGICAWFLSEAAYHAPDGSRRGPEELVQAGDRYTWKWHQFDGEESGTLLEADGKKTSGSALQGIAGYGSAWRKAQAAYWSASGNTTSPQTKKAN